MAITNDEPDSPVATLSATIAIRIPDTAGDRLVTEAERRLASIEGVRTVDITEIRNLDPRLSATVITVTATLECSVSPDELRTRLSALVCVERIDQLQPVES